MESASKAHVDALFKLYHSTGRRAMFIDGKQIIDLWMHEATRGYMTLIE